MKDHKEQNEINLKRTNISQHDLMEKIRLQINQDKLKEISKICIERNGQVSLLRHEDCRVFSTLPSCLSNAQSCMQYINLDKELIIKEYEKDN